MSRFCFGLSLFLASSLVLITSIAVQAQDADNTTTTTTVVTTPGTPAPTTVVTTPATTTTTPTAVVTTPATSTAVVVEKPVIVTAVPAPKETIATPTGFLNCFTVKAGWYQDVWVADHRVCQYANSPSGEAWIEGYWTCTKYSIKEGQCTNWEWKTAHWEKTLTVY